MDRFTTQWEVTKEEERMLLRDYVRQKGISRAALTDIKFKGGDLLVNDKSETVRYVLAKGDKVKVCFPAEQRSEEMIAEEMPLAIVYEDEYVLVLNKPSNLSTIPSREHPSGTLANAILAHYDSQGLSNTVHIVTRLDRDTSGLLLVAKNRFVHHILAQQQQKKQVRRVYKAIVQGLLQQPTGTIHEPIGRKESSIIEREVREDGQVAITHYEVEKAFKDVTLVKVILETGRTHQIRVHFSYIGHPLIGDDLYGGKIDQMKRQALHSAELSFFHPFLEKQLTFQSLLPQDMSKLIEEESGK